MRQQKRSRGCCLIQRTKFGDGSAILYVDCSAADGSELGRVAHDFLYADPGDMLTPELAARARAHKPKEGEMAYDREHSSNKYEQMLIDRNYEAGLRRGVERGIEQGLEQGMERGIGLTVEAIAANLRAAGLDEAAIREVTSVPRPLL